ASRGRALISPSDPRYPELAWTEAVALIDLGRGEEVKAALDAGISAAHDLGQDSMEWRLRVEQFEVRPWLERGSGADHGRSAREAVRAFESLHDSPGLARAYRLLGDTLHFENHFE